MGVTVMGFAEHSGQCMHAKFHFQFATADIDGATGLYHKSSLNAHKNKMASKLKYLLFESLRLKNALKNTE